MRLLRRILCWSQPVLVALLFFNVLPVSLAQSGPAAPPIASHQPPWDEEAVRSLADSIAADAAPAHTLAIDMKNISSLSAVDAAAAFRAVEASLESRHLQVMQAGSVTEGAADVQVTFSEGQEGYLWIAEIHRRDTRQVEMVALRKHQDTSPDVIEGSLILNRRLIWRQRRKILDFAFLPSIEPGALGLAILEPEKLTVYATHDTGLEGVSWEVRQTIPISPPAPLPRDLRGYIDAIAQKVELPGLECGVDFARLETMKCTDTRLPHELPGVPAPKIQGHEGTETAALAFACGADPVLLATGTGDWTQPDSIQGYEGIRGQEVSSGDPLEMSGPVLSMRGAGSEALARAVVFDLKSGFYEAYLVSAACGH